MEIACLDLEGVLVPEIWMEFAQITGIDALKATTRDVADYDVLMQQRLRLLDEHGLGLAEIQAAVANMRPLDGATDFLGWMHERFQVVVLSDTFYEFSQPLMRQLDWPTLLCHRLVVDSAGKVADYTLRQKDPKRQCVKAFRELNFRVIAAGDSYNDTSMLEEADAGILFKAPDNVTVKFPQYPAVHSYDALRRAFVQASNRDIPL